MGAPCEFPVVDGFTRTDGEGCDNNSNSAFECDSQFRTRRMVSAGESACSIPSREARFCRQFITEG
eukprot:scaffold10121_cov64-Cyclotella_meneghiniana.AAC.4